MAKIKLSAIVSEMRGKLNGSVFSKNRGGAYLRTKVTPINPNTASQGAVRATLTTLSQGWRNLTQNQRDAWNSAVANFTGTDIFGDVKTPSGINLYTKLNLNLANAAQAFISLPPVVGIIGYFSDLVLTATAGVQSLSLAFTGTGLTAGQTVVIEATPCMSAGINFAKSEFRVIGTRVGNTTSPMDLLADYQAKFGNVVAGKKVFIRVKAVDNTSGVCSQFSTTSVIVAA